MRSLTRMCSVLSLLGALILGLSIFRVRAAAANDFIVNSLADTHDALLSDGLCADAAGACTLRTAVEQANADPARDRIGFGVTGRINLTRALPDLSTDVTIDGPGAGLLTVRRDTGGEYRVFTVAAGATVVINGLTVANGFVPAGITSGPGGGGVLNSGTLSMSDCVVTGNSTGQPDPFFSSAQARGGGGIQNDGLLTLTRCSVSNNKTGDGVSSTSANAVGGSGGGVYNNGDLTMTDCTVDGNKTGRGSLKPFAGGGGGGWGGGIYNNGTTMRMTGCTVSGNSTGNGGDAEPNKRQPAGHGGSGGGIANSGTLTVVNCVVSGNSTGNGGKSGSACGEGRGGDGGGIWNSASTMKLSQSTVVFNRAGMRGDCGFSGRGGGIYHTGVIRSSIIALNQASEGPRNSYDMTGSFDSRGYNYVGVSDGFGGVECCLDATDRRSPTDDPGAVKLDPFTLVPLPESPAVDAGLALDTDGRPVTTDKRGLVRPFDFSTVAPQPGGDNSDIGAFERQGAEETQTPTPTPTPTPATTVQFTAAASSVGEGCAQVEVALTRAGPNDFTTIAAYAVLGRTASQRGDFTYGAGRIIFAPGEVTKAVPVLVSEDAYAEGTEELIVSVTSVTGGEFSGPNPAVVQIIDNDAADGVVNPIDDNATFVCQHYHDFLGRHPDPAGQEFWTSRLDACNGEPGCLDRTRTGVSAAFFLSIEFQQKGYFVMRVNAAAYGTGYAGTLGFPERFVDEMQRVGEVVVGAPGWEQELEANKQRYLEEIVNRIDFQYVHNGQNAEQYVDSLFSRADVTPTKAERDAALSACGAGDAAGRARALHSVAESWAVFYNLYNPATVEMLYFAYLRRSIFNLRGDGFIGYGLWVAKLDQVRLPGENVRDERVALARIRRAELVRAFLLSAEYRGRFQGEPNRGS